MPVRATTTAGVGLVLAALVSCSSPAPSPAVAPHRCRRPRRAGGRAGTEPGARVHRAAAAGHRRRAQPTGLPGTDEPRRLLAHVGADDWTAGFYAAALWRTYERTQ